MAALLFSEKQTEFTKQSLEEEKKIRHRNRCKLFETISSFFPEDMTQPTDNLIDMIPL